MVCSWEYWHRAASRREHCDWEVNKRKVKVSSQLRFAPEEDEENPGDVVRNSAHVQKEVSSCPILLIAELLPPQISAGQDSGILSVSAASRLLVCRILKSSPTLNEPNSIGLGASVVDVVEEARY